MDYQIVLKIFNVIFPLLTGVLAWCLWSLRQKFVQNKDLEVVKREIDNKVSKSDFKEFQKEYYKDNKNLGERLVRIETLIGNMASSMIEIKEYLFKRKRKD